MLLGTTTGKSVATVRAKALLALFAVYGLRSGEVSRLQLGDFDWRDETFLVDHSKRGGLKKYPLQRDVGDAILDYITNARPRVLCRNVFLTLTPPYRAVEPTVLSHLISKRIRKAGICCHHNGPHSLRHACATRLLEEGATFKRSAISLAIAVRAQLGSMQRSTSQCCAKWPTSHWRGCYDAD